MKTVKWGILGPGNIAALMAEELKAVDGAELYAVGAQTWDKAKAFADKYSIPRAYGSYDELLADKEVEVIYIAVPNYFHHEWIIKTLKAKKHVFCEKTITMNAAQLREEIQVAEENGVSLSEALTSAYMPVMSKVKELIDSGKFGPLHFITVTCGSYKEYDENNRFFSPKLGGGALFDIGCYAIGFANFFMNDSPTAVKSSGVLSGTGVDLKSGFVLHNEDDQIATVALSLRSKTNKIGVIACENANIVIDGFKGFIRASKAVITYLDETTEVIEFPQQNFVPEILDINETVRNNLKTSKTWPIQKSLRVLEQMDEARKQWGYKFDFE